MKVTNSGVVLWTKVYTGETKGTNIVVDSSDNIYVAGNYFGNVTINNISYSASPTYYSIFLQKLNTNGDLIWFKNYDMKTSLPNDVTVQLAVSENNTILLKSLFANTIQYENQTFTSFISTNPNVVKPQILALYNSDGENLWVNQYENPNDNTQFGIAPDKTTNIALRNNAIFFTSGSSRFNGISYSSESGSNIFTTKLNLPLLNVEPTLKDEFFTLFPNPTKEQTQVQFNDNQDFIEISITNIVGKLIFKNRVDNTDRIVINFNETEGVYFIKIKTQDFEHVKKVVKY